MFEAAEVGRTVSKRVYRKQESALRQALLEQQRTLREQARSQVIVVFAGVDGAGKGETANLLNEWMDARWLINRAFDKPADVERQRPEFWRYWLALPPRGRIGLFLSSWYSPTVLDRVYARARDADFERRLERIIAFENALADDGAVILKFWMHLSRDAQAARLRALETDPLTRGRVTKRDWKHWKMYDKFVAAAERTIMRTNTGKAPWHIVEGLDAKYRSLTVATILRDALLSYHRQAAGMTKPVGTDESTGPAEVSDAEDSAPTVTVLTRLDMSRSLTKDAYRKSLARWQATLYALHRKAREQGVSTVLVFEGPDAAGKGGAIRRLTAALDARNYQVHGFAVPTDEERAQHYLWRFWRHLEPAGRFTIFDRSWYGRVLVERVQGLASDDEWRRAYAEVTDFEEQLIEHGIVLAKFWIHITPDEQLERFRLRERTPHKRWKLTKEDWRNREKWDGYELAANDMVQYTSTSLAPWTLVEGNDKRFARIKVLKHVCKSLEAAMGSG